jgi:hypothetical protein
MSLVVLRCRSRAKAASEGIIAPSDLIAGEGGCSAGAVPRHDFGNVQTREAEEKGSHLLPLGEPRHRRSLWHPSAEPACREPGIGNLAALTAASFSIRRRSASLMRKPPSASSPTSALFRRPSKDSSHAPSRFLACIGSVTPLTGQERCSSTARVSSCKLTPDAENQTLQRHSEQRIQRKTVSSLACRCSGRER